jgi:DNA-binding transcriptional regulator LsrR (DeoR family)
MRFFFFGNNAIGRLKAGETQTHVSRVLNVSQNNISRLWDRYQQQGSQHMTAHGRQNNSFNRTSCSYSGFT